MRKIVLVSFIMMTGIALLFAGVLLAGGKAEKTLERSEDPVVIKASDLGNMKGANIEKLSLFAYNDGSFQPVPFQVDERLADGLYIYTEGPDNNADKGNKKMDGHDELVFMARDSGDKAPADASLPCSPSQSMELALSDPAKGGKAWLYFAECGDNAPRSGRDYVSHEFDGSRDWVKSDRYHFSEKRGESYFDWLALKDESGEVEDNLVDRLKGRGTIRAAAGMIKIDTPESDVKGSLKAWIDGPVRVIHLMEGYIKFSVVKLNIGGVSQNLFYPNYFVTPITVNTPVPPDSVLTSFGMRYAIDWNEEFEGTRYYDPVNDQGVTLDGEMSEAEKNMDYETGHEWYALAGEEGNMVVRLVLPDKWRGVVPQKLYYVDDEDAEDPPESEPGQRCAGFVMDDLVHIPAGKHTYHLYYMVPAESPPASVPDMLNILDKPVKVKSKKRD